MTGKTVTIDREEVLKELDRILEEIERCKEIQRQLELLQYQS